MRGMHDLGGLPAGKIDRSEHPKKMFEKSIDALNYLAGWRWRYYTADEHRRAIESLTPEQYHGLTYYERWSLVFKDLMIEKGLVTEEEVAQRVAEIRKQPPSQPPR